MTLSDLTAKGFIKVGEVYPNLTRSAIDPNYGAFCLWAFVHKDDVKYMGYIMTDKWNLDFKIDFILAQLKNPSAYYQRLATAIKSLPASDVVDVYALKLKFGIPVSSRKKANGIKKEYKDYESLPWE